MYGLAQLFLAVLILIIWAYVVGAVVFGPLARWFQFEYYLWSPWQHAALLAVGFAPGGILALIAMGTVRRAGTAAVLQSALTRPYVDQDHCPTCRYELVGLAAPGSIVTCPECGATVDLRSRSQFEHLWVDGVLRLSAVVTPESPPSP
jgi:hypothetical protein